MNEWKSERKLPIFLKLPYYPSLLRVCSNHLQFQCFSGNDSYLFLLPERHPVRIYWAVFSAWCLPILQCVTCRWEGLAALLWGGRWVPVPCTLGTAGESAAAVREQHGQHVCPLDGEVPCIFRLPQRLATKWQTRNPVKSWLSDVASCFLSRRERLLRSLGQLNVWHC